VVADTTSATGSLLLYHMATNPDKQEILFKEIRYALYESLVKIEEQICFNFSVHGLPQII
jgi:cytochrome P450